jgi:hypothetical protein
MQDGNNKKDNCRAWNQVNPITCNQKSLKSEDCLLREPASKNYLTLTF